MHVLFDPFWWGGKISMPQGSFNDFDLVLQLIQS